MRVATKRGTAARRGTTVVLSWISRKPPMSGMFALILSFLSCYINLVKLCAGLLTLFDIQNV